jgi:hypothetical protein
MKWLLFAAAVVAAFLAARILLSDVRRAGGRSTFWSLLGAAISLAILAAVLYLAHYLGWFAVAFVAVVFVPFGLVARWSLLATHGRRDRYEAEHPPLPPTHLERAARMLAWPLLVALAIGAMALGAAAAVVASWR